MSRLYVIASPIGNMEDITMRAARVLREDVDLVFCEDTRQTRKLLNHLGLGLPAYSLHSHSTEARINQAVNALLDGKKIAYLTDAGTPGISDPGARLVQEAAKNGIPVIPLPGPSALTSLISACGFPDKEVIFAGFLSKKDGRRKSELKRLGEFDGLIVLYESPHRIIKLLAAIDEIFPGREIVIGREMTKIHEEFIRGSASEILKNEALITWKGEFSVVIRNRK
ncbi:MAG TPA: 16S rRNA (cytidine(1402)-2'-O)-methyltransferase [Spirochaetota bacterium]|nr:16S rRNA (cytidine(1402)-2'-O)-methyltransferase [Spirochaetota bacterium]